MIKLENQVRHLKPTPRRSFLKSVHFLPVVRQLTSSLRYRSSSTSSSLDHSTTSGVYSLQNRTISIDSRKPSVSVKQLHSSHLTSGNRSWIKDQFKVPPKPPKVFKRRTHASHNIRSTTERFLESIQARRMAPSGKKCGNKLYCGHVCRAKEEGHMCSCPLKWTIYPGCGHTLTGSCFQSISEAMRTGCLATCGRVLECEHICKEACSSLCVCPDPDCDGMVSLANQVALVTITPAEVELENMQNTTNSGSEVELEVSVRTPLQNLASPPEISTVNPQQIPAPLQPTEYGSALLAARNRTRTGNSTGSKAPQPSTSRAAKIKLENAEFYWNEAVQPEPQPVDKIPPNQMEQIKKLVSAAFLDKTVRSSSHEFIVFTQCGNEHLFTVEKNSCPECGCPAVGPNITLFKEANQMTPSTTDQNTVPLSVLQQILISEEELEDAWKLGLVKCSLGHYFFGTNPHCDICGEPSPFFMDTDG